MATYYLPFEEIQRGWYEFEADDLEHAKQLAEDTDFVMDLEANYKDGRTEWFVEQIEEEK
jgi:hypothetical protein